MFKKDKVDRSLYTRLIDEKEKNQKTVRSSHPKDEKVDRSLYTRLKEDKDQRVDFTSYSNPMYTDSSNSSKSVSQQKFSIKTFVPPKSKND